MNIEVMHLKNTLWKSFDEFPKDSDMFIQSDFSMAYVGVMVCIPNVFVEFHDNAYQFDVVKIVAENPRKIIDVKNLLTICGPDGVNESFKFLKRMNALGFSSKNDYNFRDSIVKIIDEYCTEGYVPSRKRWCMDYEFSRIFQNLMFDSMVI